MILKLAPKPSTTDRVLEVCDSATSEHVQWLCSLYREDELPPGIQKLVGKRIIAVADGGDDFKDRDRADHDRDKRGHDRDDHNKRDKKDR